MLFSKENSSISESPIINLCGVSKSYKLFQNNRERLKYYILRLLGTNYGKDFWALKEINFSVSAGETVGIIGVNGSGKSTLLQIVSGILEATDGKVQVKGKVVSLLELGAGFSPEFTGRENILFNGAILGMSQKEIRLKEKEIIDFSGIEDFIDQPVRTYSSGMYVRLAFSVAAHLDASILIIDEALSVGDEAFVRKCYKRLEDFKQEGGTILFVSHALSAITALSDRVILLNKGRIVMQDIPRVVLNFYHKISNSTEKVRNDMCTKKSLEAINGDDTDISNTYHEAARAWFDKGLKSETYTSYGSGEVIIAEPHFCTMDEKKVNVLVQGDTYFLKYRIKLSREYNNFKVGMLLKSSSGIELGGYFSIVSNSDNTLSAHIKEYEVSFKFICNLNSGVYFSNVGVSDGSIDKANYLARVVDAIMFKVIALPENTSTGYVNFIQSVDIV